MSLVDGRCVLLEPIGWLCLQLDWSPLVAKLSQLPPFKSGTLYWNTSSQLPRCSPSGVTWKRFYCNNLSAYSAWVALVTYATKTYWLIDCESIASTHCTYPRKDGLAEWAWTNTVTVMVILIITRLQCGLVVCFLGGSLLSFLRKHGSHHTIKTLVKICQDAASGMKYLASLNCIHR